MDAYQPDTNLILHYVRDDVLAHQVEKQYGLIANVHTVLISVVIEAEIRAFAQELFWGAAKRQRMENFLALCTIVPIPFAGIVDAYVQVSDFSRRAGRVMGKNDLWIAATAMVTGATLLTTDKDFDHLDPLLLARHLVDPAL